MPNTTLTLTTPVELSARQKGRRSLLFSAPEIWSYLDPRDLLFDYADGQAVTEFTAGGSAPVDWRRFSLDGYGSYWSGPLLNANGANGCPSLVFSGANRLSTALPGDISERNEINQPFTVVIAAKINVFPGAFHRIIGGSSAGRSDIFPGLTSDIPRAIFTAGGEGMSRNRQLSRPDGWNVYIMYADGANSRLKAGVNELEAIELGPDSPDKTHLGARAQSNVNDTGLGLQGEIGPWLMRSGPMSDEQIMWYYHEMCRFLGIDP